MSTEEIKESLCVYDKRNPYYTKEAEKINKTDCYCDNCFRGKHQLANELLKVKQELEDIKIAEKS